VRDPGVWLCGVLCLYPLIFFALPGFLLGRYRVKLRSPVQLNQFVDKTGPTAKQIQAAQDQHARLAKQREDRIGYGSGK